MDALTWLKKRQYHTSSVRSFVQGPSCGLETVPFRSHTVLKAHCGCVNALALSDGGGDFMASGGDDMRVLLWNIAKTVSAQQPQENYLVGHTANIFSLCCKCLPRFCHRRVGSDHGSALDGFFGVLWVTVTNQNRT